MGTGNQAKTQLLAINEVMDIEEVKAVSRSGKSTLAFKDEMEKIVGCDVITKKNVKDVCDCDILVTTTPSHKPVVMDEWISDGTHINAIGADAEGKEELDPALLRRSRIVVDDIPQASHSGEINVPLSKRLIVEDDISCEIGEVIAGMRKGRTSASDITVFDSTGLAIQDVASANLVYERALEKGVGVRLKQF